MCTTMFIAAVFTIAKTWKQPKCPLTDEWIKETWYIYTMEYTIVLQNITIGETGQSHRITLYYFLQLHMNLHDLNKNVN